MSESEINPESTNHEDKELVAKTNSDDSRTEAEDSGPWRACCAADYAAAGHY